MTKRLLALVAAVAMIAISIAVRSAIDGDGDGGDNGSSSPEQPVATEDLRIVCVEELEEVCADLGPGVKVEPAGDTAARVTSGDDVPFDVWLTYAPFAEGNEVLASTPLGFAMRSDRAEVLAAHCGEITWSCVGTVADEPWSSIGGDTSWGAIRPAHAEPVASALGRLVLGQAVASFLGTESYSRIDWEANDEFPGWFQRLERAVPSDAFAPGTDPYAKWLQQRQVGYDVVATTGAQADDRDNVIVIYPAPVAVAEVVLAPIAGGAEPSDDARQAVLDALTTHGYNAGPAETDGLPSAGVLEALTQYWESVVQ